MALVQHLSDDFYHISWRRPSNGGQPIKGSPLEAKVDQCYPYNIDVLSTDNTSCFGSHIVSISRHHFFKYEGTLGMAFDHFQMEYPSSLVSMVERA
jgi:hypothetical protein